ncbi:MAG: DUF2141 domain-containing protein [Rhodospirillales bacterium]
MFRSIQVSILLWGALTAASAQAADLSVTVQGLASDQGDVHIAVYNVPETFPNGDGMLIEGRAVPNGRRATWTFKGLEPGTYAIATFHDANGNHSFDQGVFGIPLEDFGFSMGARAILSAPAFEDAAFTLEGPGRAIMIDLGND